MRISDWSSDVCSSDLFSGGDEGAGGGDSRERGFSGYINPASAPVGHGCPDCVVRPIPGGRGRACCLSLAFAYRRDRMHAPWSIPLPLARRLVGQSWALLPLGFAVMAYNRIDQLKEPQ